MKENMNDEDMQEILKEGKLFIKKMYSGDKSAVREGLDQPGALYRFNGIVCATLFNYTDEDIIDRIKALKDDHVFFSGYTVSDFAIAALSVLGIEEYKGDSRKINSLIEVKLNFS
jgi:hypothetical protein